jgi:hypothetical protein
MAYETKDASRMPYDEYIQSKQAPEIQRERSDKQKKRKKGALTSLAMMTFGKRYSSVVD